MSTLLPVLILAINQTDKESSRTFSYYEPDSSNSGGSRPSDMGGGGGEDGHPDPEITEGRSPKNFFSALRASVWSKNNGGPGPRSSNQ